MKIIRNLLLGALLLSQTSWAQPGETWRTSFYDYVNAEWTASHPIPADKGSVSSYTEVTDATNQELKSMFEGLAGKKELKPDEQRLLNLYLSYTDLANREKMGLRPLASDLGLIEKCATYSDIAAALAKLAADGIEGPLSPIVTPDKVDSTQTRLAFVPSGTLLEQEDFLDDDAATTKRQAYAKMLVTMFRSAGFDQPEQRAEHAIAVEKALSQAQISRAEARNPQKTYNPMTYARVAALADNLYLQTLVAPFELTPEAPCTVFDPAYLSWYNANFRKIDVATWQDYLRARVLVNYSDVLTREMSDAGTEFGRAIGLAQEEPPLWLQGIDFAQNSLPMLVGKIYVEEFFDEKDKVIVKKLIQDIQAQAKLAITDSKDFSPATREKALEKLSKMTFQIGYPDSWDDFSSLAFNAADPVGNKRRAANFLFEKNCQKLFKPVDRKEFAYSPHVVNAFYNQSTNSFVVLAGILKPPYFNPDGGPAAVYGGLGFVVGHEIGHAFDDTGRYYDGNGNLNPWWEPADLERFQKKKDALIAQANAYAIIPGLFLNGPLEVGEIIGDKTGSELSLAVFERVIKEQGLDRLQALRDFFSYQAQVWRDTSRDGVLRSNNQTDGHPPGKYRTDGIVRNVDTFYEVFPLRPGDPLYLEPAERVKIW